MAGNGWEPLPEDRSGREPIPQVRERTGCPIIGSGCPPRGPGVVGRPSRGSGSGQEALPEVWEWSGVPSKGPGVVERPSLKSESGH